MDPNHCKALIDACESGLASQGVVDMYAQARRLRGFVVRQMPLIEACQSRESLEAYLCSSEVKDETMQHYIGLMYAIPQLLQQFMAGAVRAAANNLPAQPRGPSSKLSVDQQREVIEFVGRLSMQGVSIGNAQERAGQRFGISRRAVQRVWQTRASLAKGASFTMEDIWKLLC